jgi:ABC-type transporter Mla subunit MlaD
MDIHVYIHDESAGVNPILQKILTQLGVIMAGVADIKASVDALSAKVTEEETVIDSVVTLLNGLSAMIADLKAQLAAAIANNDPAAIQAVADSLAALSTKVDADKQKLADAATANTPAA